MSSEPIRSVEPPFPTEHGPRERLRARGPHALRDDELVALLLRTGGGGRDALALANHLLGEGGLRRLARATESELCLRSRDRARQGRQPGGRSRARETPCGAASRSRPAHPLAGRHPRGVPSEAAGRRPGGVPRRPARRPPLPGAVGTGFRAARSRPVSCTLERSSARHCVRPRPASCSSTTTRAATRARAQRTGN